MATRSQLEADLQHFKDKNPDWVMYKRDRELVQTYYNLLSYKPFSTGAGEDSRRTVLDDILPPEKSQNEQDWDELVDAFHYVWTGRWLFSSTGSRPLDGSKEKPD